MVFVTTNWALIIVGGLVKSIQVAGEFRSSADCRVKPTAFVDQERTILFPFCFESKDGNAKGGITIRKTVPSMFAPPVPVVPYKFPSRPHVILTCGKEPLPPLNETNVVNVPSGIILNSVPKFPPFWVVP